MSATMEQMLTTLVSDQKRLADSQHTIFGKIDTINGRLEEIIRIEERQANDRAALNRMGREIDAMKTTIHDLASVITDLRITSARNLAIGGGSGSIATAVIGAIIYFMPIAP